MILKELAEKFNGKMIVSTPEGETFYTPIPAEMQNRYVHDVSICENALRVALYPSFHHESTPCISVPLKNGKGRLYAEIGGDPDYPEIFTYVKDDEVEQDLTVSTDKNGKIAVLVWANPDSDDCSHEFDISILNPSTESGETDCQKE